MKPIQTRRTVRARRKGAAAVEFAFVLPFLALMFSAAVDFGRIFYATQVLDQATANAAMCASGTYWVPTAQTSYQEAAVYAACVEGASLNPPLAAGNVSFSSTATTVTVTVVYDYPLVTAVLVPSATVQLQRTLTVQVALTPGS
jgi:Flp pilus assembly protein TadG